MNLIWHETGAALRAVKAALIPGADVHLAVREMPGEGIEGACGAVSSQLPLEHSFSSDPREVTCGGCLTPRHVPRHVWDNAVSYRGGR